VDADIFGGGNVIDVSVSDSEEGNYGGGCGDVDSGDDVGPSVLISDVGPSVVISDVGPSVVISDVGPSVVGDGVGEKRKRSDDGEPVVQIKRERAEEEEDPSYPLLLPKASADAETQVDDGDIDGASDADPERAVVGRVLPAVAAGCAHTLAEVVSLWRTPLPTDVKPFLISVHGTEVVVDALERIQVEEIGVAIAQSRRFVDGVEARIAKGFVRLCYFNGQGDEMLTMNDGAHVFLNIRIAITRAGRARVLFAICDELASYAAPRRGELRSIVCAALVGRLSAEEEDEDATTRSTDGEGGNYTLSH
jgi:hypothetical protein